MYKQLEIEIATARRVARSRGLSVFHKNATTWELLLVLAANGGESDLGVYNTLHQLETEYLGQSALLKFLQERRSDGLVTFTEHEKRSMRLLRIAPEVHSELMTILWQRNQELARAAAEDDREPGARDDQLADNGHDITSEMPRG